MIILLSCKDYVLLAHTIFKYSYCSIKCNSHVNVNTHLSKFASVRVNIHLCLQTVEQGDANFRYFTQGWVRPGWMAGVKENPDVGAKLRGVNSVQVNNCMILK